MKYFKIKQNLKALIAINFLLVNMAYGMSGFEGLFDNDFVKQAAEGIGKAAGGIADDFQRMHEARNHERNNRIANLKRELDSWHISSERRALIVEQLRDLEREKQAAAERQHRFQDEMFGITTNALQTGIQMVQQHQQNEATLRRTAVEADMKRRGHVEAAQATVQATLAALRDPQNLKNWTLAAGASALLVFGAWHGLKFASQYLQHLYRNPELAQETSMLSLKERALRFIKRDYIKEDKVSDVILEPELAERIESLAESIKNTVKNNAYFRNILFYGPPGTGKTMLSKRIARSSGLEYIYFSGSSIDQFSLEEGLIKLTELFEFAKNSSKKLMIIIDEAEMLFANRSRELSEKSRKLLNLLLTYTGTESKNYFVIALTNRPEDLDSALINRCDEQIEIGAPNLDNRVKILKKYIAELLVNYKIQTTSLLDKLRGKSTDKYLAIDNSVLDQNFIDQVARKLENFVGRDISKLVISVQAAALTSKDCKVTKEIFNRVVDQKLAQKKLNS